MSATHCSFHTTPPWDSYSDTIRLKVSCVSASCCWSSSTICQKLNSLRNSSIFFLREPDVARFRDDGYGAVLRRISLALHGATAQPHHLTDHCDRLVQWHRLEEARVQVDRHRPDIQIFKRPADGLVQQRAGNTAVHDARIALMLFSRCKAGRYATVIQFIKSEPQADGIIHATKKAIAGVVLSLQGSVPPGFWTKCRPQAGACQYAGYDAAQLDIRWPEAII